MKNLRAGIVAILSAVSLCIPHAALATNGMWLIGYGAKSRGMGGTGIAYAQGGMAAAFNPASMIAAGSVVEIGGEFFNPPRAIAHDGTPISVNEKSGSNLFLIPSMGAAFQFSDRLSVGFAMIGAGLGTRFDQRRGPNGEADFFNFLDGIDEPTAGTNLMQAQLLPSIAYRVFEHETWGSHTLGISGSFAAQQLRVFGVTSFGDDGKGNGLKFGAGTGNISNKGNDYSFGGGFRVGWLSQFFDEQFSVGFVATSRVYMSKFDKYKNLLAQQGDLDIPASLGMGFAYDNGPLVVTLDAVRIFWKQVNSLGNLGPGVKDGAFCTLGSVGAPCLLGKDTGFGFGWRNQNVYKLGVAYNAHKKLTLRTGYNFGKSPLRPTQVLFNQLAPATVEQHFTLGFTYRPTRQSEWSLNYVHAFKNTITGPTRFLPEGLTDFSQLTADNAALTMLQRSLGMTFSLKF